MEIKKKLNFEGTYDIQLVKDGKKLTILWARVLDLYMVLEDGERLPFRKTKSIDFDINVGDKEIYGLFDKLYNDVIDGNIFETASKKKDRITLYNYNLLVDENKNIVWVSDDGRFDEVDRMKISKMDNSYRLTFTRTENQSIGEFKDPYAIYVRLRTSGSRYDPFYVPFIRMFRSLQGIDEKLDDKVNDGGQSRVRTKESNNEQ